MTEQRTSQADSMPPLIRGAIYIAIGALLLAAIVCVVWVFIPDQGGLIGRAFLTVLLLAGFSGAVLLDANLAGRRPPWLVLVSIVTWVIALLVGAFKIWLPVEGDAPYGWQAERIFQFLLVVGILQLALLHQRFFWPAHARYVTAFTRAVAIATTALVAALAGMLVFSLTFPRLVHYSDWYWRSVVAVAILACVGTLILPLLNALFAPRRPSFAPQLGAAGVPQAAPAPAAPSEGGLLPWPMFPDGVTPLPMLPDGQPDFAAYQTGTPSPGARMPGTAPVAGMPPAQQGPPPAPPV